MSPKGIPGLMFMLEWGLILELVVPSVVLRITHLKNAKKETHVNFVALITLWNLDPELCTAQVPNQSFFFVD